MMMPLIVTIDDVIYYSLTPLVVPKYPLHIKHCGKKINCIDKNKIKSYEIN